MKHQINPRTTAGMQTGIPSSGDVAGIELRMLPPFIRNNHSIRIPPILPGRSRLYCLTLVVSDVANQLSGLMDLNTFSHVGREEALPINKTVYYWEPAHPADRAPGQVHAMCSIIKSKGFLREAGQVMEQAKSDEEYKDLVGQLTELAGDVASLTAVSNLTMRIAGVVGRYLGRVDDRPLGTVIQSFTRLHGDWDRLGITPIRTVTRDVDFNFELIIRDRERLELPVGGATPLISRIASPLTIPAMKPL